MSAPAVFEPESLLADTLAHWAAGLRIGDIPEGAIREAKRCILDVIGVTYAGATHPTAQLARAEVAVQYNTGSSTVLGSQTAASTTGAAFANGVAAHAWDYDDVSIEGMVHGSAAVWPAVLAVAEAREISGTDLLVAFIAGVEAEYALGRAFTPELFFRGWWTTGLLGAIGAAIGAGRAMGLDAPALAQAIRIAATQATGPYVLVGTPVKPYACGRAAEAGVQAANLAAAGLMAPSDVFEHGQGFTAMFANGLYLADEMAKIGSRYVLDTSRLTFKRYPVCAGAQGSIEAVLGLIAEHGLTADRIGRVRCEVTPAIGHYMQYRVPGDTTEAQFSLPYCVACALRFGGLSFAQLSEEAIRDPQTLAELAKVEVVLSDDLAAQEKSRDDYMEPVVATIWTVDGTELSTVNPAPTGSPIRPIANSELEAKFRACTERADAGKACEGIIERVWNIEQLPTALELLHGTP
ncbi:MAG: MmgE/PrpD family protein [Proteobacteria bacterium]|nr:MmgE/PrpD family protein [Pseudomonadota bacterium]